MEKIGMAVCYVGIGAFYAAATWALVKFTKAALDEHDAEKTAEKVAAEAEPVPAS